MSAIVISSAVMEKLRRKHGVTRLEVVECFHNREGIFLIDDREPHRRHPPTLWVVAETSKRRLLKVVLQMRKGIFRIITAYEPNPVEMHIYETKGKYQGDGGGDEG